MVYNSLSNNNKIYKNKIKEILISSQDNAYIISMLCKKFNIPKILHSPNYGIRLCIKSFNCVELTGNGNSSPSILVRINTPPEKTFFTT